MSSYPLNYTNLAQGDIYKTYSTKSSAETQKILVRYLGKSSNCKSSTCSDTYIFIDNRPGKQKIEIKKT